MLSTTSSIAFWSFSHTKSVEHCSDAESKVKLRLVLDAIATQENLEVGEEDIDTEYGLIASQYNMEKEKVKELIPASSISYDVRLRKALDLIKDSTNK